MKILKPWYTIDIDVSQALQNSLNLQSLLTQAKKNQVQNMHFWFFTGNQLSTILNQTWIDRMQSMSMPVKGLAIFYRRPGYIHPTAHIDLPAGNKGKLGVALNWCVGPDDAEMIWYNMPKDTGNSDQIGGQNFMEWPLEILEPISQRVIGNQCTLVRIDIPHNIEMHTHPRWLFSVRLDANVVQCDTWEDQVKFFQNRIIQ